MPGILNRIRGEKTQSALAMIMIIVQFVLGFLKKNPNASGQDVLAASYVGAREAGIDLDFWVKIVQQIIAIIKDIAERRGATEAELLGTQAIDFNFWIQIVQRVVEIIQMISANRQPSGMSVPTGNDPPLQPVLEVSGAGGPA